MGFLAPWFLVGAALIGLPLYLHLLRRHTTTPHPFSSLMFFERRTQSSIRHRRLRYLALLTLRLLVLLLLVLAFGSRVLPESWQIVLADHSTRRAITRIAWQGSLVCAIVAALGLLLLLRRPGDRPQPATS